jgi:hypothetical protein
MFITRFLSALFVVYMLLAVGCPGCPEGAKTTTTAAMKAKEPLGEPPGPGGGEMK